MMIALNDDDDDGDDYDDDGDDDGDDYVYDFSWFLWIAKLLVFNPCFGYIFLEIVVFIWIVKSMFANGWLN